MRYDELVMTPQEAISELQAGKARPVYVVVGEEQLLAQRVVQAARAHVVEAAVAGFNVDVFEAGESAIDRIVEAVRTLPMMSKRRLVLVRSIERLEKGSDDAPTKKGAASPSDRLAELLTKPCPETCLMLVGSKLDGRRRLAQTARKVDALVTCDPLKPQQLPAFLREEAKARGNALAQDVAQALVDLVGSDLGALSDAIERLSLYVGPRAPLTEDAVHACIARVRIGSVWGLADAVLGKDRPVALRLLHENYDARDRGLPLLGLLASNVRRTLKLRELLLAGSSPDEAAKAAGIPPFRARDAAAQARRFADGELERALQVFAEVDLQLKGSRCPPQQVLEDAVLRLTA